VQISAGDSHSAALTSEGKVYYWGTFRDNSGSFGLTPDGKNQPMPIPLAHHLTVIKIASGILRIILIAVFFLFLIASLDMI
jgi:regulator of chromosome condensation